MYLNVTDLMVTYLRVLSHGEELRESGEIIWDFELLREAEERYYWWFVRVRKMINRGKT